MLTFIDRYPTLLEVERFRLMLSTFQDGSGMLAKTDGRTLPGWRDFERAVAATFSGESQENKSIFDVILKDVGRSITIGNQLYWLSIALPDPTRLHWYYAAVPNKMANRNIAGGHLNGDDEAGGRVFEWYRHSGGQLKFYPKAADALWQSTPFQLEKLIDTGRAYGLADKAKSLFPDQWDRVEHP